MITLHKAYSIRSQEILNITIPQALFPCFLLYSRCLETCFWHWAAFPRKGNSGEMPKPEVLGIMDLELQRPNGLREHTGQPRHIFHIHTPKVHSCEHGSKGQDSWAWDSLNEEPVSSWILGEATGENTLQETQSLLSWHQLAMWPHESPLPLGSFFLSCLKKNSRNGICFTHIVEIL